MHSKFKISFLLGLVILFKSSITFSQMDPAKALKMKMKGMYLYQFAKNVYWPSDYNTGDFSVGIFGSKDLFNLLNTTFKDKVTGSQKIVWDFYETASDIKDCHLLFVCKEETNMISKVTKLIKQKTLLVTELADISNSSSSMINLLYVNSRLRYQLNKSESEKNNFKFKQKFADLAYSKI